MKRYFYIFSLISVLTNCTDFAQIDKEAVIESCSLLQLTLDVDSLDTRGVISASTLPSGSKVGVYLFDIENSGYYMGKPYANVCYTVDGSSLVNPDQDILLAQPEGLLFAYYPYTEGANITSLSINTASQEDYMYAQAVSGLKYENANAALTMNHAMAVLSLNIVKGSYSGACNVSEVSVKSSILATSGLYNGKTGEIIDREGFNNKICSGQGGFTLNTSGTQRDIILIPSTSAGTLQVSIVVDGILRTIEIPSFIAKQAKRYGYTLIVNEEELSVSDVDVELWQEENEQYGVYISGDTENILFNRSVSSDGIVIIRAGSALTREVVNPFTYSGDANITSTSSGNITEIIISDIESDVYLNFDGITCSYTLVQLEFGHPGTNQIFNSEADLSDLDYVIVNGIEQEFPMATVELTTGGIINVMLYLEPDVARLPDNLFNGISNVFSASISPSVKEIGSGTFKGTGLTNIKLSEGLTSIGNEAFSSCNYLLEITLPSSLKSLSSGVFSNSGLRSIIFPNSLTTIGEKVFQNCTSLQSIDFGGVTKMGMYTFDGCTALKTIDLQGVSDIPDYSFHNCTNLSEVINISPGRIGKYAFAYCRSLEEVNIGFVSAIDASAFENSGLRSFLLPDDCVFMGDGVFANCSQLAVVGWNSVLSYIPKNCFYGCSGLKGGLDLRLSSVAIINAKAFYGCSSITELLFPKTLTKVDTEAFWGCYSLGLIRFTGSTITFADGYILNNECDVYVPSGSSGYNALYTYHSSYVNIIEYSEYL